MPTKPERRDTASAVGAVGSSEWVGALASPCIGYRLSRKVEPFDIQLAEPRPFAPRASLVQVTVELCKVVRDSALGEGGPDLRQSDVLLIYSNRGALRA